MLWLFFWEIYVLHTRTASYASAKEDFLSEKIILVELRPPQICAPHCFERSVTAAVDFCFVTYVLYRISLALDFLEQISMSDSNTIIVPGSRYALP